MSAVTETFVREYFELHGFLVRQQRKHVAPARRDDETVDFLVLNPNPEPKPAQIPFLLASRDLPNLRRAIVVIKGWHSETFSPTLLENQPDIFKFIKSRLFRQAARTFAAGEEVTKILVVPALPHAGDTRSKSLELLQCKGIDAIIQFRTMLADLVDRTEASRNYQKSDLLQIIRILKNYDFLREPQLELFKPKRKRDQSKLTGKV